MQKIIFTLLLAFCFIFLKAQTPKISFFVAGINITPKTLSEKTKPVVIRLDELLKYKKFNLSDTSFVVEKYTFSIYVGKVLKEFKENGNTLSDEIIEELNDLKESKEKKFNVYLQEIVASNRDDKDIKVPDEKFILEK